MMFIMSKETEDMTNIPKLNDDNETHDFLNRSVFRHTAKEELDLFNIVSHLNDIKNTLKDSPIHHLELQAKQHILTYIITCATHDPEEGDYYNKKNKQRIIDAGKLIDKNGGLLSMRLFFEHWIRQNVPRRYHREIELYWDGIGGWRG